MGWFSRKKDYEEPEVVEGLDTEETPTEGPWDEADYPERGQLLDAGSLWIPAVTGTTLQFSMDKSRKQVLGIVYLKDNSALQMQAFAAPRSRGLWDEVRRDMLTSIAKQGGSSKEAEGPFGPELVAQMPVPNQTNPAPHRFLGIDGPRWLLRATLYGRAGSDEAAANEMLDILRQVVVVRGQTPHPPRELLPLEIPQTKGTKA